ncbi:MAG: hypothetical protein OHK93_004924 [Ramalina farinacea]|uniref:Uncharacterized protein n=1 Tax=Ramalina farinacea TaxID=258253 RepID=A0AA43QVD3_9LECA|nr:hypothetical protein [Ramalina farinacea]
MAILSYEPRQPPEPERAVRIPIKPSEGSSPSPIFRLPPEIRCQIYFYIFLSHTPQARPALCPPDNILIQPRSNTILLGTHRPRLSSTTKDFLRLDRLAPLLTSRQLYHEALPILYGQFDFHFPENLWIEDVRKWLDPIPLSSRRMIKRVGVVISVYANEEGDERSPEQQRETWGVHNGWRDPENLAYKHLKRSLPRLKRVHLSIIDESKDECILGTFWHLRDMLVDAVRVFKGVPEVIVGRFALDQGNKDPSSWGENIVENAKTRLEREGGGALMTDEEDPKQWARWVDVCRV